MSWKWYGISLTVLLVIPLLFIYFPIPIGFEETIGCIRNYASMQITTGFAWFFGVSDCMETQIDLTELKPVGYCREKGYSAWSRGSGQTEENCIIFEHKCKVNHYWWVNV